MKRLCAVCAALLLCAVYSESAGAQEKGNEGDSPEVFTEKSAVDKERETAPADAEEKTPSAAEDTAAAPAKKEAPESDAGFSSATADETNTPGEESAPKTAETQKTQLGRLVFTAGPAGILNVDKNSAPSPILFTVGAGGRFALYSDGHKSLSVAPHGHYFASFYFWDAKRKRAFPAEIEQRVAYVPSVMFDSPLLLCASVKNSIFAAGVGPAFLLRFAVPAAYVSASKKDDIKAINQWFWQNGRFFYVSLHFSWDYVLSGGTAVGLGTGVYFPLSAARDKDGLNGGMLIIGARIIPPKRR